MTPPLVGLIGKKRAGKDTVASTLVEEFGFARVAFADPLKAAALRLDPIVRIWAGDPVRLSGVVERMGWEAAKEIPEVRRTLQEYGVAIREIEPDFWVRAGLDRAHAARYGGEPVVVTDVRFPNEAEAIEQAGGTLVRVVRPGLVSTDTHVSETALDEYPTRFTISNGGTLDDLADAARDLAGLLSVQGVR